MNAIPLTSPTGTVVAWQCGVCLHVPTMGRMLVGKAKVREFAASAKDEAEDCCRCERCKDRLTGGEHYGACSKCQPAADAEMAKREAEWAADHERQAAIQEQAYAVSKSPDAARALAELMSDISEECYCAGWLIGLEFDLWAMVLGGSRRYGMDEVSEAQVAEMRRLSDEAGGWMYWLDGVGEVFIPVDDWLVQYAA